MANTNINRASILNLDSSTAGTVLARGTTAERPSSSIPDGAFRFNTTLNKLEYYDGSNWYTIDDEAAPGSTPNALNNFETKLYTGNGVTQSIGGYINGAGSFNGSNSSISITDGGIGNNATARVTYSISIWVKTTSTSAAAIIGDYDGTDYSLYLQMESTGKLSMGNYMDGVGSYANGNTAINDGNWHNLIIINNTSDNTQKLFIDGNNTPDINHTLTSGTKNAQPIQIGYYATTGGYVWNGSIDQVRLYNIALSSSNITALYNETAATATTAAFPSGQTAVATYTMDTSANGLLTTTDLSTVNYPAGAGCIALYEMNGNANDTSGTYTGTANNITYQSGAFNEAIRFSGAGSNIETNIANSNFTSNYSISFWVNLDNANTFQNFVGNYQQSPYGGFTFMSRDVGGGVYRFGFIFWYPTGALYNYVDNNDVVATSGQWAHLVVTKSSSALPILYVNGTANSLNYRNTVTDHGTTSQNFKIGNTLNNNYSAGLIDQVRVFNTELTQSQVTTLARGIATSYSGSATNVNFNGSLNFQPDLVWVKARDAAHDHVLVNSINGAGSNQGLSSNATYYNGEYTATYGYISSLDSNGFTVSAGSSYANYTNVNNEDYVSWNWKAGGAAVNIGVNSITGSTPSIASDVNANTAAGFSIAKVTFNTTSPQTVAHGLSSAPEWIISKRTSTTSDWNCYHKFIDSTSPADYLIKLNSSDGKSDNSIYWNDTIPTSSVFTTGSIYDQNETVIFYCWHSVSGYSKIGAYSGSGVSGKEVALDFNPSFVLIKRSDNSTGWVIVDSKRGTAELYPNLPNSEDATATNIVLGTNKFTLNSVGSWYNASGTNNYIYVAFA